MRSPNKPSQDREQRLGWLLAGATVIALVWLIVLPLLATTGPLEEQIQRLDAQGVDPGALFYSDHPRAWNGLAASTSG